MRTAIVIAMILATPAIASPMWEQADRWTCTLERHMRVADGTSVVEMDPNGLSFGIDFGAGTLSSAFVGGAAPIIARYHHSSDGAASNILIADWETGEYPVVIQENGGSFWQLAGSGTLEQGDEVWMAMYRCLPDVPES
ncbi:hypothetical protein [Roseovarius sp. 2305UL8-3]|uniref:hypothetical protein n=1 Tax=Roseovarius conchicola TaxID=3121636 RepID=UPI0035289254